MKRIYTTLAIAAASMIGYNSNAQSMDIRGVILLPLEDQIISPGSILDTNSVRCYIGYFGPDDIYQGDGFTMMHSFSRPADDPGFFYVDGISFNQDILYPSDTGYLLQFPNGQALGTGHVAPFQLASDSINILIDYDWYQQDSFHLAEKPYVKGKEYLFYFRGIEFRDQGGNAYSDPVPENNTDLVRIIWGEKGVGLKDMIAAFDNIDVNIYPNPATDVLNISFSLESSTNAKYVIRDAAGRVVLFDNYGKLGSGKYSYSIDVSELASGMYSLDFSTLTQRSVVNFTVK